MNHRIQAAVCVLALMSSMTRAAEPASVAASTHDSDNSVLAPGPHLFLDWRYVADGDPVWAVADGRAVDTKDTNTQGMSEAEKREFERQIRWDAKKVPWGIRIEA